MPRILFRPSVALLLALSMLPCRAVPGHSAPSPTHGVTSIRPLRFERDGRWLGEGIAYGPHRDGQRPGGAGPSRAEIAEDLRILARHWRTIRIYGSAELGGTILRTIRDEGLDLHVMLGAWIGPEETPPDSAGAVRRDPAMRAANRREVAAAIRLANAYPGIVSSVCVGNETQVFWSAHRCAPRVLTGYLRQVRSRTRVPVTTADDFNFWNKPESGEVARECDFLVLHAHPLWNGLQREEALDWTRATLADARARHPDRPVVLGETGWATRRGSSGDQAKLMKGRLGEEEQAAFFRDYSEWVRAERVPSFFFEAFDENWKGSDDPDEVEKHWGLYRADRTPKRAMAGTGPVR